jgi:hypothetical protein
MDVVNGLVARWFGSDLVLLSVTPQGFAQADIVFYHTTSDCSGDRFLANNGGLFAYFGQVLGSTVFYTRLADSSGPVWPQPFLSAEIVRVGDDPANRGSCSNGFSFSDSLGRAIMVNDTPFTVPFRLH